MCLHIEVQMPKGLAEQRTYVKLGPGPTRAILDDLLDATSYNYVIESSALNNGKILAIVLTDRMTEAAQAKEAADTGLAGNLTMTPARRVWLASRDAARPAGAAPDGEASVTQPADGPDPKTVPDASTPATPPDAPAAAIATGIADHADQGQNAKDPSSASVGAAEATAPAPPPPPVAAPTDADSAPAPSQVLQNQINQMQQLFEQRKNMIANPTPPANSTMPPPSI